jgi:hypothetical protein
MLGFMTKRKSNRNKEANLIRKIAGAPYPTLLVGL